MKDKKMSNYIIFWLSQAMSQLGSSMTSYALIIWSFKQTHSAMSVSIMTFCSYLPYILGSIFAGTFIDAHAKKKIIIISDTVAACCSMSVFILLRFNTLEIWNIYIVNAVVGFMNAFQSPATSVAVGLMVPKDKYHKVSGMDSFAGNLVTVVAPMLAGTILSFTSLSTIVFIDLMTFVFSIVILIFQIEIRENIIGANLKKKKKFDGFKEGCKFLQFHKGIFYIMLSLSLINFFSRLTYENILLPMILARSNGDSTVYGIVSGVLGMGGILGGIFVSTGKKPKDNLKMIFYSAGISFLLGDLLMGVGKNVYVWSIAGLTASFPIPFIMAGQKVIMYEAVPKEIQGRIFAVRNAIQFSSIPVGILLGGYLADYIFEPFMKSQNAMAIILQKIVGVGAGSGMAVMFLCTGVLGSLSSFICYRNRYIQKLKVNKDYIINQKCNNEKIIES